MGLIFVLVAAPLSCAFAQAVDGSAEQQPMLFQATPQNPGPNTEVKFTVTSYLTDFNAASISWYVNGKKMQSGTGLRTFSAGTGAVGSTLTVRVVVITQEGNTIDQEKTFRSGAVDLLWETNSYTPPFYQGKALPGKQSQVKVVAMPRFGAAAQENYIFSWQKNGQNDSSQSGYGKNSFVFTTSSLGNPTTISVSVSSTDRSLSAQNSIVLKPNPIKVIVYEFEPAYGTLYAKAVSGNLQLTSSEASFSAVPYFAPLAGQTPQYAWTMNGNLLPKETNQILTLRNDSGAKGQSQIYASVNAGSQNIASSPEFSVTY